jgi:hypothetical protein
MQTDRAYWAGVNDAVQKMCNSIPSCDMSHSFRERAGCDVCAMIDAVTHSLKELKATVPETMESGGASEAKVMDLERQLDAVRTSCWSAQNAQATIQKNLEWSELRLRDALAEITRLKAAKASCKEEP